MKSSAVFGLVSLALAKVDPLSQTVNKVSGHVSAKMMGFSDRQVVDSHAGKNVKRSIKPKAVTESWTISISGDGCKSDVCTKTTFTSYSDMKSSCLSKLHHPCDVTVTSGTVAVSASSICTEGDRTSASIYLGSGVNNLAEIAINSVVPGLSYSTSTSCTATDKALSFVHDLKNSCTGAGSLSTDIPSVWTTDTTGKISIAASQPDFFISNTEGTGDNSPALFMNAGTGTGCTLTTATGDLQLTFSGRVHDSEISGVYYRAMFPKDGSCEEPEQCKKVYADKHLFVNECLARVSKTCKLTVEGKSGVQVEDINVCQGANSVAYIPTSADLRDVVTEYNMYAILTGLKYTSSSLDQCSGTSATTPVFARIDKTVWNERLCEGEPIKTPVVAGIFSGEGEPAQGQNLVFVPSSAVNYKFGPSDYGFALSSGKTTDGCTLSVINDTTSIVYFKGDVNPLLLDTGALSYLSASIFAGLVSFYFYF